MATYVFRCPECAEFDVLLPMSELAPVQDCPRCGRPARRVYTAPALTGTNRAADRARSAAEASAEAPPVVHSLPPGARTGHSPGWSPFTGAAPQPEGRRETGRYQPLPRP